MTETVEAVRFEEGQAVTWAREYSELNDEFGEGQFVVVSVRDGEEGSALTQWVMLNTTHKGLQEFDNRLLRLA